MPYAGLQSMDIKTGSAITEGRLNTFFQQLKEGQLIARTGFFCQLSQRKLKWGSHDLQTQCDLGVANRLQRGLDHLAKFSRGDDVAFVGSGKVTQHTCGHMLGEPPPSVTGLFRSPKKTETKPFLTNRAVCVLVLLQERQGIT